MTAADLIPFVAVLAAAITALSTLAGIRVASQAAERQLNMRLLHEDHKAQKEALRTRLEELYQLVDQWSGEVVGHHITYRNVMYGRITYNQALDITIKNGVQVNAARLFTLADLYFPRCHELFAKIREARDRASRVESDFTRQYRQSGEPSAEHARDITDALEDFNESVAAYRKSLSEYAREV